MKTAIIILIILGMFDWKINGEKYGIIPVLMNIAALICFIIFSGN